MKKKTKKKVVKKKPKMTRAHLEKVEVMMDILKQLESFNDPTMIGTSLCGKGLFTVTVQLVGDAKPSELQ